MNNNERHPQYKIRKDDTLQTITNNMGVELSVWKQYHNNMCTLDDIIRDDLPKHLTQIYLLPQLWYKELALNFPAPVDEVYPKPTYGYNNTLYIKNTKKTLLYGVEIAIRKIQKGETKLRYKIKVNWQGEVDGYYQVEVESPTETYINNLPPELKAERLAIEVYNSMFPFTCKINDQGQIIAIKDFTHLQKRWSNTIEKIRRQWVGEDFEKYIRLNTNTMTSEEIFRNKLERNLFVHALFNGIYQSYTESYTIDRQITLPLEVGNANEIIFGSRSVIAQRQDKYGLIFLKIDGTSQNVSDCTYNAKYFINAKTHFVYSMIAEINTPTKDIILKITEI